MQPAPPALQTIDVDNLPSALFGTNDYAPANYQIYNGEKYPGGFGPTQIYEPDYWTLRERSGMLFRDNIYARGLLRRLITNEINTGLTLASVPNPELIEDLEEEVATDWAEDVENRWQIYANEPSVCDFQNMHDMGTLQQYLRREALIDGDMLVVLRYDKNTKQDRIQLIRGHYVRTPPSVDFKGEKKSIEKGVETDAAGRHIAYWVAQKDGLTFKRLPAYGGRSGRRLAWLHYGTDRRFGTVRGEPLLSILLSSLKEIDRYRDSAQRKAVINSMLAMYITKTEDKMGTMPMSGAAVRRDAVAPLDGTNPAERSLNFNAHIPGVVLDELQQGEEPKAFKSDGTDVNFPVFEAAIIQAIAWANEMPPEILTLQFSNNYSASQAAINEFKIYLNRSRADFAKQFCIPVYHEWLYNELIAGRITAPRLLARWNMPDQYQYVGAWRASDWTGAIKPSTDIVKQTKGYKEMINSGLITHEKAAKELNGTKFRVNIRRLKRENELLAEAMAPLAALQTEAEASASTAEKGANNAEDSSNTD